jgi:hypothetical protein
MLEAQPGRFFIFHQYYPNVDQFNVMLLDLIYLTPMDVGIDFNSSR